MRDSQRPLSWKHARSHLREALEEYAASSRQGTNTKISSKEPSGELLSWWLPGDVDLYLGALTLSLLLLLVASFSFASKMHGFGSPILHPSAHLDIYFSSLIASALLVLGALLSIFFVRRRRFACSKDADTGKRREILRFLDAMKRQEEDLKDIKDGKRKSTLRLDDIIQLNGTALTDIYPVYRMGETSDSKNLVGSWSRIPTLLLVRGDMIALQVGDISPAKCCKVASDKSVASSFEIEAGERITLASIGETANDVALKLPRGRSTLPSDSMHLLTLCNRMRIFVLQETPLEEFLRRPEVPPKVPMVLRQIYSVRSVLPIVSVVLFLATLVITFSRPGITSGDLSLILPLPLLAALGLLPVTSPALIVFWEILGTARILVAVHAHARVHQEPNSAGGQNAKLRLLMRYIVATTLTRLALWDTARRLKCLFGGFFRTPMTGLGGEQTRTSDYSIPKLVRVPPASVHLLEKLGVSTAFTLVDDDLACEPNALPQQLLIPSEMGLKLLDICPTYDDDSQVESEEEKFRAHEHDSDSDSDDMTTLTNTFNISRKRIGVFRRRRKGKSNGQNHPESFHPYEESFSNSSMEHEVQFEDPLWWQHLPALKCIGLGCLLVGERDEAEGLLPLEGPSSSSIQNSTDGPNVNSVPRKYLQDATSSLVRLVCAERRSNQLRTLAQCIGFSTESNSFGARGDLSPFTEKLRLHVISNILLKERLEIDPHERGSEESRWWGLLRPDATSVVVRDSRSQAYQLLTVGDPIVVTSLCHEAWQGKSSTILPLSATDRETILSASESWKLANLDATAFSYSPLPSTSDRKYGGDDNQHARRYLLTQSSRDEQMHPTAKDKNMSGDWSLINNQIFLGVLGSLVIPRNEIRGLLKTLSDAGVRFVYFSPRNMRRQKEVASQMGIDVAWNCAISLRPLESGEDDPHRMVSNYADWDVNAKLPHGIENVRKHLREDVDTVPLKVNLFTDVTKHTTMEMVETFQEYHDTVISVGLSHLPSNSYIFSQADIAVGVDVLESTAEITSSRSETPAMLCYNSVLPPEVTFVSAISAHSCAFRLPGHASLTHIPSIICQGRAALEAATSAAIFFVAASLSFSLFVFFCSCATSKALPFIPTLGAVLYLQVLLPAVGLTMAMSDSDKDSMNRVPPKNDQAVMFGRSEGWRLYLITLLKATPPAVLPQVLYLIAFGELLIEFEPDLVEELCLPGLEKGDWVSVVRCEGLQEYSGVARTSAGVLVFCELILCTVVASTAFVHRTIPILELPPWRGNRAWAYSVVVSVIFVIVLLLLLLGGRTATTLPWYYYILAILMPLVCLVWNEALKRVESKHMKRAEKMRRLQFETRLGMWSPK